MTGQIKLLNVLSPVVVGASLFWLNQPAISSDKSDDAASRGAIGALNQPAVGDEQQFDAVIKLRSQGELDKAIDALKSMVITHPKSGLWHYTLGTLYEEKGHIVQAESCYRSALMNGCALNEADCRRRLHRVGEKLVPSTLAIAKRDAETGNFPNAIIWCCYALRLVDCEPGRALLVNALHASGDYDLEKELLSLPMTKTTHSAMAVRREQRLQSSSQRDQLLVILDKLEEKYSASFHYDSPGVKLPKMQRMLGDFTDPNGEPLSLP